VTTPLIDTHLHLNLLPQPLEAVAEARALGVGAWVVPGVRIDQWHELMRVVGEIPGAWAAPGVHPLDAAAWNVDDRQKLTALAAQPQVVAIGEVGLDRHVATPMQTQLAVFCEMIQLAKELKLPLLLHCRDCIGKLLEVLKQQGANEVGGIFHAFSGSLEVARQLIDLGFVLGIGGVATYPEAKRLHEVVRQLPDEALVLETDAPDMTPHPYRGQINQPANLMLVAQQVAALRGWSLETLREVTSRNACRILPRLALNAGSI